MGTKEAPGRYDAYEKAEPSEPMFVLLARDASAPALVEMWARDRERHGEEAGVVAEARECAEQMRAWRDHNRPPKAPSAYLDVIFDGPPGPVTGRFVEVDDETGTSVQAGEWVDRGDGTWALRIPAAP